MRRNHRTFVPGVPDHATALALGLDVVIVAIFMGSLPWLGLGAFAMACGVFDGLRPRKPLQPKQDD